MKWKGRRRSQNVEDRRGVRLGGRPALGLGLGGIALLLLIALLTGTDPIALLDLAGGTQRTQVGQPRTPDRASTNSGTPEDELGQFVSVVLGDTEDTWGSIFKAAGREYQQPVLVLFTDRVQSACGFNSAAVGPFYCPPDRKVYLDLAFFNELANRFSAPGDFAQAYVVAHEVGHHVQTLLGISQRLHEQRRGLPKEEANRLSVLQELQADCLAGVWGHHAGARGLLEMGDLEEGLRAAAAIGDDRIQRRSRGYVVPESFTHGSSEQRVQWFRRGLESGNPSHCDTYNVSRP